MTHLAVGFNHWLIRIVVFWLGFMAIACIFAFVVQVISDNRDLFGFERRRKDYEEEDEDAPGVTHDEDEDE